MLYRVSGKSYEVPVERVHAALTVYDTWLRGLRGRPLSREERLTKIESIAALLAPRQYQGDNGALQFDYYAPDRLRKVLLSEIGKRAPHPKKEKPTTPPAPMVPMVPMVPLVGTPGQGFLFSTK